MLACEFDLPLGIDVPLTIISSILAVSFTFAALVSDLLWDRWFLRPQKRKQARRDRQRQRQLLRDQEGEEHLLGPPQLDEEAGDVDLPTTDVEEQGDDGNENRYRTSSDTPSSYLDPAQPSLSVAMNGGLLSSQKDGSVRTPGLSTESTLAEGSYSGVVNMDTSHGTLSAPSQSHRSSSANPSERTSLGITHIMDIRNFRSGYQATNAFVATGTMLYKGCTVKNLIKGFFWSLAITSMHYVGLFGLRIPQGYFTLDPMLVLLSGLTSWVVCSVGCILMPQMETHLGRQFLFSFVATSGVAAMHFTGMCSLSLISPVLLFNLCVFLCFCSIISALLIKQFLGMRAATFWSHAPSSNVRGYPSALILAIASIAITTCIAANAVLAHAATVAHNSLAETVYTRKKLWMAIAQKENAESAAAARSEFIASASHEIRTPLHHLQGYSDLLSRTPLTEEGRLLLTAIQRATKTLSLITNNVLDWSRLEKDGEAVCRPVVLDIRNVCESILTLLPNEDEDVKVELMVVVAPDVPHALFLDETYIHRILMNLLSNALKFTLSGYILLTVEIKQDNLIARVKDTGIGVPASFLPQLFEPFKQAQTRGTSRGTGLGLSIIKQLLHKMQGTIDVDSKHRETDDVAPEECGSTFTITIPVQKSSDPHDEELSERSSIAIFHGGSKQTLQGLCTAWDSFGYDPHTCMEYSEVDALHAAYIWADIPFLMQHPEIASRFIDQDQYIVLIPCDSDAVLQRIPKLSSAPKCIPIRKPLIWHLIKKNIATAQQPPQIPRLVRFASDVDIHNGVPDVKVDEEPGPRKPVVLLVEDNPVCLQLYYRQMMQPTNFYLCASRSTASSALKC